MMFCGKDLGRVHLQSPDRLTTSVFLFQFVHALPLPGFLFLNYTTEYKGREYKMLT